MSPALDLRTVFRACVVSAVREGEPLMGKLVEVTRNALTLQEESSVRNIQQRNNLSDALNALKQHEAALLKGLPHGAAGRDLAEGTGPTQAQGSPGRCPGMDFGELSLMDDSEVQDQVELARAQQLAAHATEGTVRTQYAGQLCRGLRSVQPERNPLRPENYIRALQRVVSETGATSEVRQLWMQHMRGLLNKLLEGEYQRMAKMLRDQGVQPVGYAVLGTPGGAVGRSGYGAPQQAMATRYGGGYATGYGHTSGYGGASGTTTVAWVRPTGWQGDSQQSPGGRGGGSHSDRGHSAPDAGGADPFNPPGYAGCCPQMIAQPASRWENVPLPCPAYLAHWDRLRSNSCRGRGRHGRHGQLERLVNRLAEPRQQRPVVRLACASAVGTTHLHGSFVAPTESPAVAADVVANMMATLAQDARLLPPMQLAVKKLEAAAQTIGAL